LANATARLFLCNRSDARLAPRLLGVITMYCGPAAEAGYLERGRNGFLGASWNLTGTVVSIEQAQHDEFNP
jgi:hypothetical protein